MFSVEKWSMANIAISTSRAEKICSHWLTHLKTSEPQHRDLTLRIRVQSLWLPVPSITCANVHHDCLKKTHHNHPGPEEERSGGEARAQPTVYFSAEAELAQACPDASCLPGVGERVPDLLFKLLSRNSWGFGVFALEIAEAWSNCYAIAPPNEHRPDQVIL